MDARLTKLDEQEILRYLGYQGQEIDHQVKSQIQLGIETVSKVAKPRLVYRIISLQEGKLRELPIQGQDALDLLEGCQEVVFFAITLGNELEKLVMKAQIKQLTDALIMDTIANVAIENVCNNFCKDLEEYYGSKGYGLTDCMSPGYGDLPLGVQSQWAQLLNAQKRIGLVVTKDDLLLPRKSLTGLVGISTHPRDKQTKGCQACSMYENCPYKKKGIGCHE